jgi:hypothetical protein
MSQSTREWSLVPFGRSPEALGLRLEGRLERVGARLQVTYVLRGDLDSVVVPPPAAAGPRRADGLWEHTCFELFLAAEGAEAYWEVNLAPSGEWNLYRLEGYRRGLAPVLDREALPFLVERGPDALRLFLDVQLPEELALACRSRPLRVGVTAVMEQRGGALSYWALVHGGAEADFHRRGDFLLRVGPEPLLGEGSFG